MPVDIKPRGTNFTRSVIAKIAADDSSVEYAETRWGQGSSAAHQARVNLTKSAQPALTTVNADDLAPTEQESDFIALVDDGTALGRLSPKPHAVPFNVGLIRQSDGADAAWIEEGEATPLSQMTLATTALRPKRVSAAMVVTDELVRHASVNAENALRRDLARALAFAVDAAFLSSDAATDTKPAGILNGVQAEETYFGLFAGYGGDLTQSCWIGRPELWVALASAVDLVGLRGGTFRGAPAIASRAAPEDALILLDVSGLAVASGALAFDTSKAGLMQMETAPTQEVSTPTAVQQVGLWQCDCTAVRIQQFLNWSIRAGSVGLFVYGSPGSPS